MGEIADGVNALISLGRGDVAGATLSATSMLPIVGDAIGKGGKIARAAIKHGDEVLEAAGKVAGNAKKLTANIPQNVTNALEYIKKGINVPGADGGKVFKNRGGINPKTGNVNQNLPKTDSAGNAITYTEWDVNPKTEGKTRDSERIVTGSDGSIWWTTNHYETFTQLE